MNEFKFIKKGLTDLNVKTGLFFSPLALCGCEGVIILSPGICSCVCPFWLCGKRTKLNTDGV